MKHAVAHVHDNAQERYVLIREAARLIQSMEGVCSVRGWGVCVRGWCVRWGVVWGGGARAAG